MEIRKLLQTDVTLCLAILVTCTLANYLMTRLLLSRGNNKILRMKCFIIRILKYKYL